MNSSEQKRLVASHFDDEARLWSARYGGTTTFQSYNFIVRRKHVLQLFDKTQGLYLDAGCGSGDFIPELLKRGGDVFAIDVAAEMIAQARQKFSALGEADRIHLAVADVNQLDFPQNYFDAVIGVGLVEYLSRSDRVFEEFYRVLKHGGILIITVPNLASPFMALETLIAHGKRLGRRVWGTIRRQHVRPSFARRHFIPWRLDRQLTRVGFRKIDYAFCTYGFFSLPRAGRLSLALSMRLDRFAHSPVGILGTNYIVKVAKP